MFRQSETKTRMTARKSEKTFARSKRSSDLRAPGSEREGREELSLRMQRCNFMVEKCSGHVLKNSKQVEVIRNYVRPENRF